MDVNILKGKIVERCGTIQEFCDRAVFNRSTFDRKMNGKSEFTMEEVRRIVNVLSLSEEETRNIFFADVVA